MKYKWAATWQNKQSDCAPSDASDQPGHPPSLIRVFAVRMKKAWVLSYRLSAQRRLWSDWADAQADLSLHWAHSHFVGFVKSRLKWLLLWRLWWTVSVGTTSVVLVPLEIRRSSFGWARRSDDLWDQLIPEIETISSEMFPHRILRHGLCHCEIPSLYVIFRPRDSLHLLHADWFIWISGNTKRERLSKPVIVVRICRNSSVSQPVVLTVLTS